MRIDNLGPSIAAAFGRVRAVSEANRAWVSRSATTVALVSTVGTADMPGRSRPFRRWSSSTIFTGTRCTILVKLPVALSGGSSANSSPLAGDRLSTWPRSRAVKTVDLDLDRLAVADMRELRLLEVRDHVDCIQRHDRHQLRAGLHILSDPERARADRAIHRCLDLRVGKIERGLLSTARARSTCATALARSVVRTSTLRCGGERPDFACCTCAVPARKCGVGLLRALHRAGAGLHQAVVAGLFFLREFQVGFRRGDISRALLDDRLLQGELRIEVAHRGFGCGDIGIGLRQRGLEVAVVDLGQKLSGLDRLVVADQYPRDVAGDLWRDDRGIRLHIGVIGRFQVAAGGEVVVAEMAGSGGAERNRERQGGPLDRLPGRAKS